MVYYDAIPQSTDDPSDSQSQLLTNFGTLNTVFANDHVNYTTTPAQGLQGQHQFVTFNNVTTNPSLTYPTGRMYTKTFGSGTAYPELYFNAPTSTAVQFYPLIPSIKAIVTFQSTGVVGAQTLITTNTLNYNVASVTAAGSVTFTVTFTTPLTYATYYPHVSTTGSGNGAPVFSNFTTASFQFSVLNFNAGDIYKLFVF